MQVARLRYPGAAAAAAARRLSNGSDPERAALAPARLRGSYEGVVDTAFAVSWAPGVLVGLWLVGDGRGEVMLAAALPLAGLAALCFLPLPSRPVPVEDVLPTPAEASAIP